jgi:hypothetical protein
VERRKTFKLNEAFMERKRTAQARKPQAAKRANRLKSSVPNYHPATGQILSETEDNSEYIPRKPRKQTGKRKASVTIAPELNSSRDVFIRKAS